MVKWLDAFDKACRLNHGIGRFFLDVRTDGRGQIVLHFRG